MLISPDRLDEETHILEQLKGGAHVSHFETIRVRKDGSYRDVSLTISPVKDADGRIVGASKIARDITERRRTEEALQEAKQTAEAASRAKDEFLAMLGHELRNPLGAIGGAVSVLNLKGKADDETAQLREIIDRQGAHLARLLDDLLDVTRLATGKIELQRRPVDLQTVAEGALRSLAEGGKAAQHAISFTGQTLWVNGDPSRLEQVIFNLLDNAVKYTPPGGRITITMEAEGDLAVLRIADTGVGMTEEVRSRVFEPFAQARQTLDRARGGLGLGLTLVKRLVELHGGMVATHSAGLGHGTEIIVRLPLTDAREQPAAAPPNEARVTPRRVLVVDDNSDMRTTCGCCSSSADIRWTRRLMGMSRSRSFFASVPMSRSSISGSRAAMGTSWPKRSGARRAVGRSSRGLDGLRAAEGSPTGPGGGVQRLPSQAGFPGRSDAGVGRGAGRRVSFESRTSSQGRCPSASAGTGRSAPVLRRNSIPGPGEGTLTAASIRTS